jgi:hypothetical protein
VNNGEGRKRNTVRRQLLRAISHLLRHCAGNAEGNRIFDDDVNFPAEDDTREVYLAPHDIKRLLDDCETKGYPELAVVIRVAIQTSADRGVLLAGELNKDRDPARGLLVRDLRIHKVHDTGLYEGEVFPFRHQDRRPRSNHSDHRFPVP